MPVIIRRAALITALVLSFAAALSAQTKKNRPPTQEPPATEPAEEPSQGDETIKVETNLVTVPVIVSDRNDLYVPDMRKEEFTIKEDGAAQQIAFFATTTAPFNVVLMIDTSASAQQKLRQIQHAAVNFVGQLQDQDRVKVISFDDKVSSLGDFTSDRSVLQQEIEQTRAGKGTKLYDAVTAAINSLQPLKGRKAIVLFTDGVDYHSDESTFGANRNAIQESGIIVYTIRYDTRAETERLARAQARQPGGGGDPLSSVLGIPPRGTTPTTFPGDTRIPGPSPDRIPSMRLPLPQLPTVGVGRDTRDDPRNDPNDPYPNSTGRRTGRVPGADSRGGPGPANNSAMDDSISRMLDGLYKTADDYLDEMATQSGGQMVRADTLTDLPSAFATIANELRTQYSLGYYPPTRGKDDKYHTIKVNTTRKDVVVRSRPGYRASGNTPTERKPRHRIPSSQPEGSGN